MYVIAALCTLKLYHARHADVNAKSYTVYIVLSLIVLLGAGTPIHAEYYFKIAFTFLHLIACLALSLDIYYMGHCEWKHGEILATANIIFNELNAHRSCLIYASCSIRSETTSGTPEHMLYIATALFGTVDIGRRRNTVQSCVRRVRTCG